MKEIFLENMDKLERLSHEHVFQFVWNHLIVNLIGVSSEFADKLATYLALPTPEPSTNVNPDINVLVYNGKFKVHYLHKCYHVSNLVDLLLLITTLIPAAFMYKNHEKQRLHAAGLCVGEKVLLLSGDGGVGKSSISLAAWLKGIPLLGDDWLLMDPYNCGVFPVPKPMKPRMDLKQYHSVLKKSEDSQIVFGSLLGETRALIGRQKNFNNNWNISMPIGALVFMEKSNDKTFRLEQVEIASVLPNFLSQTILCERSKNLAGIGFANAMSQKGIPVFKFYLGHSSPEESLTQIFKIV